MKYVRLQIRINTIPTKCFEKLTDRDQNRYTCKNAFFYTNTVRVMERSFDWSISERMKICRIINSKPKNLKHLAAQV